MSSLPHCSLLVQLYVDVVYLFAHKHLLLVQLALSPGHKTGDKSLATLNPNADHSAEQVQSLDGDNELARASNSDWSV